MKTRVNPFISFLSLCDYSLVLRSRKAFAITETELRLIAALAISCDSQRAEEGAPHARPDRHSEHVIKESREKVMANVAHRHP